MLVAAKTDVSIKNKDGKDTVALALQYDKKHLIPILQGGVKSKL
jgi:hypothetical protein